MRNWVLLSLLAAGLCGEAVLVRADGPYPAEAAKPKKARPRPHPSPTPTPAPVPEAPVFDELPVPPEPEPSPVPSPLPVAAQKPVTKQVTYDAQVWGEVGITDTDRAVKPGGTIRVDGPIAGTPFRLLAHLDISALPGQKFNFQDPATFSQSAEALIGAALEIGRKGDLRTSAVAGWGFATMLNGEVLDRFIRRYGAGIRLEDRDKGGWLQVCYGRDEAAGDFGYGQLMVGFNFPLHFTSDAMALGGDLTLSPGEGRRDILRIRTAVSLPGLVEAIKK